MDKDRKIIKGLATIYDPQTNSEKEELRELDIAVHSKGLENPEPRIVKY